MVVLMEAVENLESVRIDVATRNGMVRARYHDRIGHIFDCTA